MQSTALLLVDIQNDFIPGGSLAVPQGDTIVKVNNHLQQHFDLVVATQDWHPSGHISFASEHANHKVFESIKIDGIDQTLWPEHCVQNSWGADFHPDLNTQKVEAIFRKGTNPKIDSYSAFFDNAHLKSTGLTGYLKEKGVKHIYFTGLAADICVYFSIKDALQEGFKCTLIEDATKALDQNIYEEQKHELSALGVQYVTSDKFTLV